MSIKMIANDLLPSELLLQPPTTIYNRQLKIIRIFKLQSQLLVCLALDTITIIVILTLMKKAIICPWTICGAFLQVAEYYRINTHRTKDFFLVKFILGCVAKLFQRILYKVYS